MVFKSPNKFYELDHMPISIIGDCIEEVLPLLINVVVAMMTAVAW